jgi:hypothetical protein
MTASRSNERKREENAQALSQSDAAIARVLEDLIDVLISRGVIQFTDLPAAAQTKLLSRREARARLSDSLQLLPEDSDGGLI